MPMKLFVNPNGFMSWRTGMNATWAGTIISATTIRNSVSRKRKLIQEKANAARLHRASGRSVEGTEMMMLFTKAPAMPWALMTPR